MKKTLIVSVLFAIAGSAAAGGGLTKYPEVKVESTKTREEVKAELAKWLADAEAQKAHKEIYTSGS